MAAMDAETIRGWVTTAETELADLVRQLEDLQRRVAQARKQLGLMYELLASVTDEPGSSHPEAMGTERSVRERVVEGVVQILREHRTPLRIQDIHAEFLRRQLALPGSGTPANIAAHLVDRDLFTRPRRGVFGLTEWGANAPPVEAESPEAPDRAKESGSMSR